METLIPILISAVIGLTTLGGSVYVAQRYQKMGGGEAQTKLNAITKEVSEALEARVAVLSANLEAKTAEARSLQAQLQGMQDDLLQMRRSRLLLQQDVDDLHAQIRDLRTQTDKDRAEMRSNGGDK